MNILQGRFKWNGTREEYEKIAENFVPEINKTPGLNWKIWAFDDERNEAFGLYYFRDDEMAQLVFDNMDSKTLGDMVSDVEFRIWDIQEELCRINQVPL